MITRKERFRLLQDYPEGIPPWMIRGGYSEKQIRVLMQGRRKLFDPPSPNPESIPPEHRFMVEPEQWDDAVFTRAIKYTAVVGRTPSNRSVYEYATFPEALTFAETYNASVERSGNLPRAMLYAVTETGRHTMLVPKRWEHYSKLWEKRT